MQEARETDEKDNRLIIDLEDIAAPEEDRIVVYTAIFAGYDDIPVLQNIDDRLDYIIFTDGEIDAPHPWQVRKVTPVFMDPQRDARRIKLLPHLFLPRKYTISVWIDASLSIRTLSREIVEGVLDGHEMALTRHSQRDCIYAEAKAVLDVNYDSPGRVDRQMMHYANRGFPTAFGLHATMFLVRRHASPNCVAYDLDWWSQVSRFSKRDQLSFDYVRWCHRDTRIRTLDMNHGNNHIFTFKMKEGREHKSGNRVVDEHLDVAIRSASGFAHDAVEPYSDIHDSYSAHFLPHLRNLNLICRASDAAQPESTCYYAGQADYLYSPPMPGKGRERELFLRAIARHGRIFDMSLDGGYNSLLALAETNVSVTALDDGTAAQNEAAGAYLRSSFDGRFVHARLEPMSLLAIIKQISFEMYDVIHINAARPSDVVIYDLACAAAHAAPGATLIVTNLDKLAARRALGHLVARGLTKPHGDLTTGKAAAYLLRGNRDNEPTAAELLQNIKAICNPTGVLA